jgi:SAM-dependent methyltransferase
MSPELKRRLRKWLWPLMPGWVDEGRRLVQGAPLQALLNRAARAHRFPCVFNAGSGEGGYSPLLLKLPGVESVVESDLGLRDHQPNRIDAKQVFFCASLASIPLPDRKFNLILCTEVLEHIQEHEQALDEIARVMAPGGWLLITVPTPPAPPDPAHVRDGYRPEELSDMLTQRGFDIIETRFCMHYFFRFLFKNWSRMPWRPRILIRGLAVLDQLFPLGPPMDLMILAQLTAEKSAPVRSLTRQEA